MFTPVSYNPSGLDKKIQRRIDRRNGFFIEAGAYDGIYASNTYLLERHFGWRGLLVEPVPKFAKLCRRFRNSITRNCALGDDERQVDILVSDTMSIVDDDAKAAGMESARAHAEAGRKFMGGRKISKVTIESRPLSALLDEIGVNHVDLLSLDVEGYEITALSGIDFSRHTIDYILVETRDLERVKKLLESYFRFDGALSHRDYLFVRI